MTIQSLWVGPRLSTMEQLSIKSFLANGHDFHLYAYGICEGVPAGTVIKDASELVPESEVHKYNSLAAFSDMFRYKMLHDVGGWWVDLDTICLRPWDLQQEYVFTAGRASKDLVDVSSGHLKAPAGSEVMRWLYEQACARAHSKMAWGTIGPALVTEAVRRFGLDSYVRPVHEFCTIPWWDCPTRLVTLPAPALSDAYSVHLCHEMWRGSHTDPDASYPKGCLYEQFKDRYGRDSDYQDLSS